MPASTILITGATSGFGEATARRLQDGKHQMIYGSLDEGVLNRVWLKKARAFIANSADDRNAAAIITARQLGFEGEILALVEDPRLRGPDRVAVARAPSRGYNRRPARFVRHCDEPVAQFSATAQKVWNLRCESGPASRFPIHGETSRLLPVACR